MPAVPLLLFPLLLATATALLPRALQRLPAAGAAFVALGTAAATQVVLPPLSFLLINGTLLWSGLLLACMGLLQARRSTAAWRLAPLCVAVVAMLCACASLWQGRPVISFLAGLGAAAALTLLSNRLTRDLPPASPTAAPRSAIQRWAMLSMLSLLLFPAFWYASIVAGPDGIWSTRLPDVPFSTAGEILLAALLLPATLLLGGVWPFSRLADGARLAPLAGLLLYTVVLPAAPDGLEHWRSPYAGWLLLAGFIAAWGSRWSYLVGAGGLFAIACGNAGAQASGLLLTVAACIIEVAGSGLRGSMLHGAAMLCAATAAIVALPGTMTTEVVYSTLFVLATIVGILRNPVRPALALAPDASFG